MSASTSAVSLFDKAGAKILEKSSTASLKSFGNWRMLPPSIEEVNCWDNLLRERGMGSDDLQDLIAASPTGRVIMASLASKWSSIPIVERKADDEPLDENESPQFLDLLTGGRKDTLLDSLAEPIVWSLNAHGMVGIERDAPDTAPDRIRGLKAIAGDQILDKNNGLYEIADPDGTETRTGLIRGDTWGGNVRHVPEDRLLVVSTFRSIPLASGAKEPLKVQQALMSWATEAGLRRGRDLLFGLPRGGSTDNPRVYGNIENEAAQKTLNDRIKEAKRTGDAAILGTGAYDLNNLAITPEQAQLKPLLEWAERSISGALNYPPTLLGDVKSGSLTDAGRRSELQSVYLDTVLPPMDVVLSKLSDWLFEDEEREFAADLSQLDVLNEDRNELHDRVRADYVRDLLTKNQALAKIDEPDIGPEGDLYYSETRGDGRQESIGENGVSFDEALRIFDADNADTRVN